MLTEHRDQFLRLVCNTLRFRNLRGSSKSHATDGTVTTGVGSVEPGCAQVRSDLAVGQLLLERGDVVRRHFRVADVEIPQRLHCREMFEAPSVNNLLLSDNV